MNNLNIGYDAKRLFLNYTGLGNYSRMVVGAVQRYYPGNSYHLFTPKIKTNPETTQFLNNTNVVVHQPHGIYQRLRSVWRSFKIPSLVMKEKLDIYHGLSHEIPFGLSPKVKSVVTIHDLIFMRYPELFNPIDRFIYLRKWKYACKNADIIVAISEQTKNDLIELLGVPSNKIEVVYQGCAKQFLIECSQSEKKNTREKYSLPDTYLLYVGTIEKRKNLVTLLKALKSLPEDVQLVAVGKPTSYFHDEVLPFVKNNNLGKRVHFVHNAAYADLPAIYQSASVFLYPSIFEGFGIPIIEALNSKVPVVTSLGSCFAEAGGPKSIYIDPENSEGFASSIRLILNDSQHRKEMIEAGLKYCENFTEEKIASDMMNVYRKVLN